MRIARVGRPNRFDLTQFFDALQVAVEKSAERKAKKVAKAS
jgi:hypothetical protein